MQQLTGIKKGDLIAVRWVDSRAKTGWVDINEDVPLGDITTVGFVVSNTAVKLTLTSSNTKKTDAKDKVFGLDPVSIPWGCIRMVTNDLTLVEG